MILLSDSQAPVGWEDIEVHCVSRSFPVGSASHYIQKFTPGRGIEDCISKLFP